MHIHTPTHTYTHTCTHTHMHTCTHTHAHTHTRTHPHPHTHTPIVEEYLVEKALVHSLMRKLDLPTYEFPTTKILKT